jgi:hypothetical protein
MSSPGPLGISQHSDLLPGSEGILARTFPLVPGPDAIARGHILEGADRAVPIAGKPLEIAPPAWMHAIFTLQDRSDGVTSGS